MSRSDTRGTVRELKSDQEDFRAHRDRRNWNSIGNRNTRRAVHVFKQRTRRRARYSGKRITENEAQDGR
jgi:hypothetical protein